MQQGLALGFKTESILRQNAKIMRRHNKLDRRGIMLVHERTLPKKHLTRMPCWDLHAAMSSSDEQDRG